MSLDENPFEAIPEQGSEPVLASRAIGVYGTGVAHPETAITIGSLEDRVKGYNRERAGMTYAEFVNKHMGADTIYVDGYGDEPKGTAPYMVEAAERALDRAGMTPSDIDTVVIASCSIPDQIAGIRGLVLGPLEMYEKNVVELNSACTGFMDGLNVGTKFGKADGDNVLVIGGDMFHTRWVNKEDTFTVALFGDAVSAAVLGPVDAGYGFKHGKITVNPDWRDDAKTGPEGYFVMDAKALGKRIPEAFSEQFLRGVKRNGFDLQQTLMLPHQVNGRLLEKIPHVVGMPPENVVNVFHKYGNSVNASLGLALHHAFRDGMLKRDTDAVLVGAGAGFNFGYLGFTADRALPEQTNYKVLFVDDQAEVVQPMVRTMMAMYREDDEFNRLFKFEPVVEYSGEDGIRRMAEDEDITFIVTDQRMGEVSGARMIESLRGRRAQQIGTVMVTGFADEDRSKIEGVGFQDVIQKADYGRDPSVLWNALKEGAYALRNRDVNPVQ